MVNRTKALKLNTLSTLLLELVTLITGLIMPRLVLTYFGSASNGLVSSIAQFLSFSTILRAGIGGAIRAALYRPIADNDKDQINAIMSATDRHMKKISIIIALAILVFAFIYPFFVIDEYNWFYAFTMVFVIGSGTLVENLFGIKCQILLQADQKYYISTLTAIVGNILVTVVSVIIMISGGNMHMVKVGAVAAAFIKPLLLNLYVRKNYQINWKATPDNAAIGQRWNVFFQQVSVVVNENVSLVLLTILAPLTSVSVFTVHSMIVFNIRAIVNSFTAGINSTFGSMLAMGEHDNLKKTLFFTEWLIFAVGCLLYSITAVMLEPFVMLYTARITDVNYYQPVFGLLMVICVFIASTRLPYSLLAEGAGKFRETRNGAILEVVINVTVSTLGVIKLGLIGVLVGTLCAGLIRTLEFAFFSTRKILNCSGWHIVKHYTVLVATFASCLFVGNISCILESTNFVNWTINAFFVAVSTAIIVLISSLLFYRKEMSVLFGNLKRKFVRKTM